MAREGVPAGGAVREPPASPDRTSSIPFAPPSEPNLHTLVSTRIQDEVIGLIDRARVAVILVSPFLRPWPEFERAIARAVARGVSITLVTRGRGGPGDRDLALFHELDVEIKTVEGIHLKVYLSEREAIETSANLLRDSLGRSLESAKLYDRTEDPAGWASVFEVYLQALDAGARQGEVPIEEYFKHLSGDLRTDALAGDVSARERHRFCILCGTTASIDGDSVICLRCRAGEIAEGRDPYEQAGTYCTRCGGRWTGRVDRALCGPCFDEEVLRAGEREVRWYVAGRSGKVEAWSLQRPPAGQPRRLDHHAVGAIQARAGVHLAGASWLRLSVIAGTGRLDLLELARGLGNDLVGQFAGLLIERLPERHAPPCFALPALPTKDALYLALAPDSSNAKTERWKAERTLAAWKQALSAPEPGSVTSPKWILRLMLAPRAHLPAEPFLDPSRTFLGLAIKLTVPAGDRPRAMESVRTIAECMTASLHQYEEVEVRRWLAGAEPTVLEQIVAALTRPAPLGPASIPRNRHGHIEGLPNRIDRLSAARIEIEVGDAWAVEGGILCMERVAVN